MRRFLLISFFILVILAAVYLFIGYIPTRASLTYGPPANHLNVGQRIEYATWLIAYGDALLTPFDPNGAEQTFSIAAGESAFSVAERLQQAGLISNSQAFLDYLTYTGLDLTIQSGDYALSPALSIVEIARALQDSTPTDIAFVILPGWRMEEIAASLPTSGLDIFPEAFLRAAQTPRQIPSLDFSPASMEGFLFPDSYTLPRMTTADQLLGIVARNFAQHITDDMRAGFSAQGLDTYQAVTLASLVQRESVHDDEQALIASVFLNRLKIGMTLGGDPTVQYALGYDPVMQTWWKNPLSLDDLKVDSPYNTYIHTGLPPAPIANPGLGALQSVAFPEVSPYYFFQARCDNSGYHNFTVTFEEHLANGCGQ
jgi:UPF0755 protein